MDQEKLARLFRIIEIVRSANVQLLDNTFQQVYGYTYDEWCFHRLNIKEGKWAIDSPKAQKFFESFDPLSSELKKELHQVIEAI